MIERKISSLMVSKGIVAKEEIEVFEYGIEIALIKIVHSLCLIVIGIVSGRIIELSIFILLFSLFRKNIEGYHAKTKVGCLIISTLMGIGLIISTYFFSNLKCLLIYHLLMIGSSAIYLLLTKQKENNNYARLAVLISTSLYVGFNIIGNIEILTALIYTITLTNILSIVGKN